MAAPRVPDGRPCARHNRHQTEEADMGDAAEDRARAAQLPEGDVVRVLYQQHARIRDLFGQVKSAEGDQRKEVFKELRTLLAVHETAEEMVVRPATTDAGGKAVADARNGEEKEAN